METSCKDIKREQTEDKISDIKQSMGWLSNFMPRGVCGHGDDMLTC